MEIEKPSEKVLEFLNWACGAAYNEYFVSGDDKSDYIAALAWLDKVEEASKVP